MTKNEFLRALRNELTGLEPNEIEERLLFYSEMIDDRIEEGLSESDAVAAIAENADVTARNADEPPISVPAEEKKKEKKSLRAFEIVLLVLGSPIWLSLLIAAAAIVAAIYICLWAVIVSLWAVFASLCASSLGGLFAGAVFIFESSPVSGIAVIGGAIALAGISILAFFGCRAATKGAIWLTKRSARLIKRLFTKHH